MKYFAYIITLFMPITTAHGWFLDSATIRIANQSEINLYVAVYYTRNTSGTRIDAPTIVPAGEEISLNLPSPKFLHTRLMLAAEQPSDLPAQKLITNEHAVQLGLFYASDYTLIINAQTGTPSLIDTKKFQTLPAAKAFLPHHLQKTPPQEQESFYQDRVALTHQAQATYCGHGLQKPLRIGLCCSGGGVRAMLATAGLMQGLEKIGILPLMQTCVGLSGSTWFLFPWALSKKSVTDYNALLSHWLINGPFNKIVDQYKDFAKIIAEKKKHSLYPSAIDFYAINLAYTLLKPLHPQGTHLTMQDVAAALSPSTHPLIGGTMVTRPQPSAAYEWLTVSPFCVQFLNNKICVPTEMLGARFYQAIQVTTPPSPILSYYLAIFGSAPSASIRDALERTPESLQSILYKLLPTDWQTTHWMNKKITAAVVENPCYGISRDPIKKIKTLALVDGVYLNNTPLEPTIAMSEDPFDMLIVLDCQQNREQRINRLAAAEASLIARGITNLPPIDKEAIATKALSIHHDPTSDGPVIVYCTVEGDSDYNKWFNPAADPAYATLKFIYPHKTAQRLIDYLSYVITSNQEVLKESITTQARRYKIMEESTLQEPSVVSDNAS